MLQRPEDGFAAFFYSIRKVYWTYFRYYQREIQSGKRKIRMAKTKKTVFFCQNCGHEEAKWLGQCPACKEWNTFVEEKKIPEKGSMTRDREKAEPVSLSQIETKGGQNPDRDGRTGPCTWWRDCQRLSRFGGRGSGNRKVHAAFADVPDSGR